MEKEIKCGMKIENIDEFNKLLEQFKIIVDKIQNFKFKVGTVNSNKLKLNNDVFAKLVNNQTEKIEINKDTTIFVEKERDSNIYNLEIANHLSRKKIADIKIEKVTDIRFHVKKVRTYE